MKKLAMILGVAALFAGTTSCKKDYVCDCENYIVTYKESTKAAASALCEGSGVGSVELTAGGVTTTPDIGAGCKLQ